MCTTGLFRGRWLWGGRGKREAWSPASPAEGRGGAWSVKRGAPTLRGGWPVWWMSCARNLGGLCCCADTIFKCRMQNAECRMQEEGRAKREERRTEGRGKSEEGRAQPET